jgi:hypothetical protein
MIKTGTKSTFKGKPLIEIPEFIPQAGFLEGDFGKAFLEEYNGIVSADYNDNSNLNVLSYRDNVVKGSNPFAVVLANQILRQEGLRTATQADLEKALKIGWDLRGTYEDTGLVLRTEEDDYAKNTPLAKDLASQVKARDIKFSSKNPVMIPLIGLELETADNQYGLTFKLKEDAEVYEAPILNKKGSFDSKDINEKIGLPKKLSSSGDRTLYTRDFGLSRLFMDDVLGLGSGYRGLGDSVGDGRVVAVSGEATAPEDLQKELYSRINDEYQTRLEDLNSRKEEAEESVRKIMSRKK